MFQQFAFFFTIDYSIIVSPNPPIISIVSTFSDIWLEFFESKIRCDSEIEQRKRVAQRASKSKKITYLFLRLKKSVN